jgi:toxin ParE1/3/4
MKDYTVVFTPRAERQLRSLHAYIADRSGEARADTFVAGIVTDCLALSTFPERGTLRADIRPNLRIKGYKRRVTIAFSVDRVRDAVVVHGIFYGGQDFEASLGDIAE